MTASEADAAQEWKGMDGATAFLLIERHANNWAETGALMEAWRRAAEREAARKCIEWINAWALDNDRHANMLNSIKQEFPGVFQQANSTEPKPSL